jgi:hypothetical protein
MDQFIGMMFNNRSDTWTNVELVLVQHLPYDILEHLTRDSHTILEQRQLMSDFVDTSHELFIVCKNLDSRLSYFSCMIVLSADWLLKYMAIQIHSHLV